MLVSEMMETMPAWEWFGWIHFFSGEKPKPTPQTSLDHYKAMARFRNKKNG